MSMPMRRVRRGRRGGNSGPISPVSSGAAVSSTSPSGQRSRISRMGVVVEDDGDDDEGDSWAWGDDAANSAATAGRSTSRQEEEGGGNGKEISLSEQLRQHELLEQQEQQKHLQRQHPQHLQSRRERGGAMLDADHFTGRKLPLPNNQSTKYSSSSADSVDSGGWSWPSMSSTTTSPNSTNNNTNSAANAKFASSSGHNKRNQRGRQYLYNKYSKRGMFSNPCGGMGGNGQIKTRIMSAIHCTKSPQHDDDDDDSDEEEDKDKRQQQTQNIFGMAKLGLMLLIMLGGASRLGRRRRIPRSSSSYKSMSSSSISMNDVYLRGQRPFNDGVGNSVTGEEKNSTLSNLSQATILLPIQISSHLSDITLPHNSNNNNSTAMNNAKKVIPYFWDVHFSGESVAEYIFSACHGLIQACELGIRQPDFNEDKLEVFNLDGAQYVNVDTTTKDGIHRAYELKLAQSHLADVIISPHFHYMTSHIFSSDNPGLMFALFRHPVDRAVSLYYYLAKATWDPHYNPDLAKMTLEQYAKSQYIENNWLTRFLVNKLGGKLSRADVQLAKEVIKTKCLVGLYDDMEVSMARFQRYFGWNAEETDENKTSIAHCRSAAVRKGDKHVVGHPSSVVKDVMNDDTNMTASSPIMPVVRPGSVAWNAIVRMNVYDMELYEFVEKIYHIQGEEIFGVVGYEVPPAAAVRGENLAETAGFERPLLPDDPFESSIATDDNPGKTMPF